MLRISLVVLLVLLAVASGAYGQGVSPEELFQQAQAASRQNDYARAEKLYRQILAAEPDILAARVNLGLACYWEHKSREAVTQLRMALQASPREFSALLFAGLAYIDLTEYDHAQQALEQARQVNDSDPLLYARSRQRAVRVDAWDRVLDSGLQRRSTAKRTDRLCGPR